MAAHRFIISGGGTGGHIYPALAIANELKKRYPNAEFLFVGALDRMEMQKVPAAGYPIEGLWISGFSRKLSLQTLLFPLKLIVSLLRSRKLIKQFRPNVVIGTGGFASGPVLYMAARKGIPTLIQEQNSYPGITNKLLARRAKTICVAYDHLERYFPASKIVKTGNPVRQDLLDLESKTIPGKDHFAVRHNRFTLLVIGGSLGARRINQLIESRLELFDDLGIDLIWQCGALYFNEYSQYDALKHVKVLAFIDRMDYAYAGADIIISRSGASSISELCLAGKPVIFIPSPNVAEDHQTKNAEAITEHDAALLVPENELEVSFDDLVKQLVNDQKRRSELGSRIRELALPRATEHIADQIEILLAS